MFLSGQFVADYVTQKDGSKVDEEDIETHGVELGIESIYRLKGTSFISNEEYTKPVRNEMPLREPNSSIPESKGESTTAEEIVIQHPHYVLHKGNYVVEYDKIIEIPDDTVGFVYPRSRLMRSGLDLTSAVWESGYKGKGEGGLYVDNQAFIKDDTRVGQIVMARAEVLDSYDGSHQHENIDE